MKVLHIGHFLFNTKKPGGIERVIHNSLNAINSKEQQIASNLVIGSEKAIDPTVNYGYKIHFCHSYGKLKSVPIAPKMPLTVQKLVAQEKYNIVHLHFPDPLAAFCTFFLDKKTKIIITWHSDVVRQKLLLKLVKPIINYAINRADTILVPTAAHYTSSRQLQLRDKSKILTVPFGIKIEDYKLTEDLKEKATKIKNSFKGKKIVMAAGRQVYYKGFQYLIEAMTAIQDAVLLLVGEGPLRETHEQYAEKLNIKNRVIFLNFVSEEKLLALYHACDLYCMPSCETSEAFGMAQAEAMACGKPVINCQLNNGVNYVSLDGITGLTVPPKNANALGLAIKKLLNNDDLRILMGKAAKLRVEQEFEIGNNTKKMISIYEKIIDTSKSNQ